MKKFKVVNKKNVDDKASVIVKEFNFIKKKSPFLYRDNNGGALRLRLQPSKDLMYENVNVFERRKDKLTCQKGFLFWKATV